MRVAKSSGLISFFISSTCCFVSAEQFLPFSTISSQLAAPSILSKVNAGHEWPVAVRAGSRVLQSFLSDMIIILAPEFLIMYSYSVAEREVKTGTWTTPSIDIPISVKFHSGRLAETVIILSPLRNPDSQRP